jgi:demethoxyubiquinone hydroxylase (CLK1/Coq7/Cat5 family)
LLNQDQRALPDIAAPAVSARDQSRSKLVAVLQSAYSGEMAAAYAYRGHWQSVGANEQVSIQKIENEEWRHRQLAGEMLIKLGARPGKLKEIRAIIVGRALGVLCHVSGWLAPMYGAGRLESRNIGEYETAARYARDSGHAEFVEWLLNMAEGEWEHELYFRSRVQSHSVGRRLHLWPQPAPKETIRFNFEQEPVSAIQ